MIKKSLKSISLFLVAMLILSACSLPGLSGPADKTVKIGTYATSESVTMATIIKLMIEEDTDLNVEIIKNLGSDGVVQKALESGDIDIASTRYSGSALVGVLDMDLIKDPEKTMDVVQSELDNKYDMTWFDSYGFDNAYVFTVANELAKKENLEKVSDLEPLSSDIEVGVDTDWMKREGLGYEGFIETYEFEFPNIHPMQKGLMYQAVNSGKMDVILAYSTDGRIKAFDLATLEDDKALFPPYDGSPVARNKMLKEHPEVKNILQKLEGAVSSETIQEMNYQADVKMNEPYIVAKDFLEENDYFE